MNQRIARHRKITDEGLAIFRAEVEKILALKTYKQLSIEAGLTLGSTQQLMAQLLREAREGSAIVHHGSRGTKQLDIRSSSASATLQN